MESFPPPDYPLPLARSPSLLTRYLARAPQWVLAFYAAFAAFAAYFAMYGFRRPFTAATYAGSFFETGVALKTSFVLSQLIGYAISKWIGVKVCSEATKNRRGVLLVAFILASEAGLVLFGLLPGSWKFVGFFLNGLPLGMIWGLVVGYLEGRRCSDLVLAALCGSFIVSSAAVKDIGRWLMATAGINETWMPAATGLLFLPIFVAAVAALGQLPPPDALDEAARAHREPMGKSERRAFLLRFAPGLGALFLCYFCLTSYRDFRDGYEAEIFQSLGYGKEITGLFSRTEIWVAVGSLLGLACINLFRDNRRALMAAFTIMLAGMAILLGATWLWQAGQLSGLAWVAATGLGAYLAYVPINAVLFERLMAASGMAGTAVFGIQLADSIGYTGTTLVLLYKDLGQRSISHLQFFQQFTWILGALGLVLLGYCILFFHRQAHPLPSPPSPPPCDNA